MSTLAQDVAATRRDTNATMRHIAIVGMIGSLFASGLVFYLLTGHYWAIAEGVFVAATVDYGLWRWLRISARLRNIDAEPPSGKVLDRSVAVMTIYLNGSAGIAPLVTPGTVPAYLMITIAHLFIPIVMLMVFIAAPNAQLLLQAKEREELDAEERRQRIAAEERSAKERAATRDREETARTENKRKEADAYERVRVAELRDAAGKREMDDRVAERDLRAKEITNTLAAALLIGSTIRAASERDADARITAGRERGVRTMASALLVSAILRGSRHRHRQRVTSPPPASVTSGSPARHQPGSPAHRQRTSPTDQQASRQAKASMGRLVELARELLAREPGMGRPTLARQLAAATGEPVTDYRAKQVLAEIEKEREAQWQKDLETVLGGDQ